MTSAILANTPREGWSPRLIVACLVAVSVSLPMAPISIAKLLLFVFALGYLGLAYWRKETEHAFAGLWTAPAIVVICAAFALSVLWTQASLADALNILVKHLKLLEILLLAVLIRTARDARLAITAFALGQAVYIASAWLLVAGVPLPWGKLGERPYAVFSSYLDQSIIFASSAAVIWHLHMQLNWPRWLAGVIAAAALTMTLLFLEGRTGYLVALSMIALMILWTVPKRWRLAALLIVPSAMIAGLFLGSSTFHDRVAKVLNEGQAYARKTEIETSSGWRLNAWHRSLQAINERPLLGHGVGSFTATVKRLEGPTADKTFGTGNSSNPHQEFLLWGVELGVLGPMLLVGLIVSIYRDIRHFATPVARSTLSVLVAMTIACMLNSALYDGLIGDFFVVTLGLLMALGIRTREAHASA
jgi:O-antigen ligase